ncbi:MAG: gamma-glutamylcyclotransferase [Verrucomicrobia bacterium]|nr:gamma-glutamylcyclotransferase [Leptolyngbya sp. ES-bin-22]
MLNVFVYGTLKPGEKNYAVCAGSVVKSQPATAEGCLYALPFGYPAMTLEAGVVHGVILSFTDITILEVLDEFERHDPIEFHCYVPHESLEQNEYDRQEITVYDQSRRFLSRAWSYIMTSEQVQQLDGILLPDGQWHPLQTDF